MSNSDNWLVQKSKPIQSLTNSKLSLVHFKILDTYLARINSHAPEDREVVFLKGELEQILGISRLHKSELDKRLDGLFQSVTIQDDTKPNKFIKIGLFERAECEQDSYGQWQVKLSCSKSAKEYIFNMEHLGYLRYKLRNVLNLSSKYSYILFLYLIENSFKKSWKIDLAELKAILGCTADTYSLYKRFNDLILKRCCDEINNKTEMNFKYTPIRKGRKVAEIEFSIQKIADKTETLNELELIEEEIEVDYGSELADLLGDAACNNEFNKEQIMYLKELVLKVAPPDDIGRCDFLREKFHKMNTYKVKNKYKYICKMLENEIKENK